MYLHLDTLNLFVYIALAVTCDNLIDVAIIRH